MRSSLQKSSSYQQGVYRRRKAHGDIGLHEFGEGDGTPLQYSCLENPMDGGAW